MTRFIVAAAQMMPRRTIADNGRAIVRVVRRAASRGASHVVTPEMFLTGYHDRFDQAERDRVIAEILRPVCRECNVTLSVGVGNRRSGSGRIGARVFIQNTVIGPDGRIVGVHSKTIPTDGDLKWCRRGRPRDLRIFDSGGLKFGVTICNDFWATPGMTSLADLNLPVRLARMGARAIFHSIASGHDLAYRDFHTRRIEERAIRACVWVVSANCASDRRKAVNAPSGIVDTRGRWVARVPARGEGLCMGKIG